jgi:hypothetical protein
MSLYQCWCWSRGLAGGREHHVAVAHREAVPLVALAEDLERRLLRAAACRWVLPVVPEAEHRHRRGFGGLQGWTVLSRGF